MKYLIAGLGNIGNEYANSRHNIGFIILDALAEVSGFTYSLQRHAYTATYKFKGRTFILIKPTTFVNLSGKAINYWLQKEKVSLENLLIVVDDIDLPFGTLRLRAKGGDAGHNGLKNINEAIGTNNYARLRFGIGDDFSRGTKVNYVLGEWTKKEQKIISSRSNQAIEMIKSFGTIGVEKTMTEFNNK